jgi:hypothetical protein
MVLRAPCAQGGRESRGRYSWVGCRKLGSENTLTGGRVLATATCLNPARNRKVLIAQLDKGVGGLFVTRRLRGAAPRIPIGDLGHLLDALLIGIAVFLGEPKLVGMLT